MRISCLAKVGSAVFGKVVQLINGTFNAETSQSSLIATFYKRPIKWTRIFWGLSTGDNKEIQGFLNASTVLIPIPKAGFAMVLDLYT